MPCNYHSTVTVVRNWVCVHMCEQESQGERNRKEGRASRKMPRERARERGRVTTVKAQLSHLTGLSCWSASVCTTWGTLLCTVCSPFTGDKWEVWLKQPPRTETTDIWGKREDTSGQESDRCWDFCGLWKSGGWMTEKHPWEEAANKEKEENFYPSRGTKLQEMDLR